MKKALFIAALFIAPFLSPVHADTIFNLAADGVNAQPSISCSTSISNSQLIVNYNDATGRPMNTSSEYRSTWSSYHTETNFSDDGVNCQNRVFVKSTGYGKNSDGTTFGHREYTSLLTANGSTVTVPSCDNLGNLPDGTPRYPDHTVLGYPDGQPAGQCFTPQAMADVDTCNVNDDWLPATSNTSQFQCLTKDDDSKCRYELKQANGSSWLQPSAEPDNCFQGSGTPIEDTEIPIPDVEESECEYMGNGIMACSENPANVCDSNGNCQEGCGTVTWQGVTQFLCFSDDYDGDGLGNYMDPDMDGDGIGNDDDLDNDGDGFDDPVYNAPTTSGTTADLSNVEGLLSQIASNTSGTGTDNGTGATASEIGEEVADELEEKLVELGDFSTDTFENSVDTKIESSESAIDTFIDSDDSDLTNAFDKDNFEGSFTAFKSLLSSGSCSANIDIPLTGKSLNLCEPAQKAQPYLFVLFAVSTFIYCVRRIQSTARGSD